MDKFKVECKRICVWEDKNPLKCVKLTINTKLFKTTDTLLEHITEKLNTNKAILSLINLDTKEPVELIDDLEEGGKYVGAENREGTFNENIKYETESERKLKIEKKKEYSLYQQGDSDYKDHDFLNFTKKYLKTIIFVLINGRERQAGKKFVFTREDLEGKWQIILNYIAHFLNIVGGLEGLYTLCGDKVCGSWELQHGSAYVAVKYHEKFKKMDYLEVYNNFFPKKSSYIVDIKAVSGPSSFVVKRGRSILCFNKARKRLSSKCKDKSNMLVDSKTTPTRRTKVKPSNESKRRGQNEGGSSKDRRTLDRKNNKGGAKSPDKGYLDKNKGDIPSKSKGECRCQNASDEEQTPEPVNKKKPKKDDRNEGRSSIGRRSSFDRRNNKNKGNIPSKSKGEGHDQGDEGVLEQTPEPVNQNKSNKGKQSPLDRRTKLDKGSPDQNVPSKSKGECGCVSDEELNPRKTSITASSNDVFKQIPNPADKHKRSVSITSQTSKQPSVCSDDTCEVLQDKPSNINNKGTKKKSTKKDLGSGENNSKPKKYKRRVSDTRNFDPPKPAKKNGKKVKNGGKKSKKTADKIENTSDNEDYDNQRPADAVVDSNTRRNSRLSVATNSCGCNTETEEESPVRNRRPSLDKNVTTNQIDSSCSTEDNDLDKMKDVTDSSCQSTADEINQREKIRDINNCKCCGCKTMDTNDIGMSTDDEECENIASKKPVDERVQNKQYNDTMNKNTNTELSKSENQNNEIKNKTCKCACYCSGTREPKVNKKRGSRSSIRSSRSQDSRRSNPELNQQNSEEEQESSPKRENFYENKKQDSPSGRQKEISRGPSKTQKEKKMPRRNSMEPKKEEKEFNHNAERKRDNNITGEKKKEKLASKKRRKNLNQDTKKPDEPSNPPSEPANNKNSPPKKGFSDKKLAKPEETSNSPPEPANNKNSPPKKGLSDKKLAKPEETSNSPPEPEKYKNIPLKKSFVDKKVTKQGSRTSQKMNSEIIRQTLKSSEKKESRKDVKVKKQSSKLKQARRSKSNVEDRNTADHFDGPPDPETLMQLMETRRPSVGHKTLSENIKTDMQNNLSIKNEIENAQHLKQCKKQCRGLCQTKKMSSILNIIPEDDESDSMEKRKSASTPNMPTQGNSLLCDCKVCKCETCLLELLHESEPSSEAPISAKEFELMCAVCGNKALCSILDDTGKTSPNAYEIEDKDSKMSKQMYTLCKQCCGKVSQEMADVLYTDTDSSTSKELEQKISVEACQPKCRAACSKSSTKEEQPEIVLEDTNTKEVNDLLEMASEEFFEELDFLEKILEDGCECNEDDEDEQIQEVMEENDGCGCDNDDCDEQNQEVTVENIEENDDCECNDDDDEQNQEVMEENDDGCICNDDDDEQNQEVMVENIDENDDCECNDDDDEQKQEVMEEEIEENDDGCICNDDDEEIQENDEVTEEKLCEADDCLCGDDDEEITDEIVISEENACNNKEETPEENSACDENKVTDEKSSEESSEDDHAGVEQIEETEHEKILCCNCDDKEERIPSEEEVRPPKKKTNKQQKIQDERELAKKYVQGVVGCFLCESVIIIEKQLLKDHSKTLKDNIGSLVYSFNKEKISTKNSVADKNCKCIEVLKNLWDQLSDKSGVILGSHANGIDRDVAMEVNNLIKEIKSMRTQCTKSCEGKCANKSCQDHPPSFL